jgi:DNA-damage-inducible protein J
MAKSASMYIRIDPKVKADVEAIYSQYGMSLTEAINVFLYQSRNIGGLPFDLRPSIPNAETLAAMKEGDEIVKSGKGRFKSADDLLKELKS